jgi:hypothetical protein
MIFKIANAPIIESDISSTSWRTPNTSPHVVDDIDWEFEKRGGMMYVAVRAVSVGTNGNADHFTYDELKKSYKTIIGKGVFVNHASNDVEKKRGIIIDAKFVEATPQEIYVITLLEMNEGAYPEFCRMIKAKQLDSVSMGVQVAFSECSICSHKAKTTRDYCFHIKMHKGGAYNGRPVYEINRGLEFIEVSWVTVGADPQAKMIEIIARQRGLDFQGLLQQAASGVPMIENAGKQGIEYTVVQSIRRARENRGN